MKKMFLIIVLIGLFVACGNRHDGIEPPFRLKWNMSFNELETCIKKGETDFNKNHEPIHTLCKCENFTRARLGGEYLKEDRFIETYFWNDSLFMIEIGGLDYLDTSRFILDLALDDLENMAVRADSIDDLEKSARDSIMVFNKRNVSEKNDSILTALKEYILTENLNRINNTESDTFYWELDKYIHIQLPPDEYIKMVTENINFIGNDKSKITIEITYRKDKSNTAFGVLSGRIIRAIYKSSKHERIFDEIKKWESKNGIIYRTKWWAKLAD